MKHTLIGIILLIALGVAYLNMPLKWRRHKDINQGNILIENIKQYQSQHHRLPENQENDTLKQLGFVQNKQGWQPAYQKLNPQHYRIIYQDGFVAPYLYWQSDEQQWALTP